jgi:hypothetical protein
VRRVAVGPLEANELEAELVQDAGDAGQREPLLLDVKDEIPATAQAVEVLAARDASKQRVALPREDRGTACANAFGGRREAFGGDELARSARRGAAPARCRGPRASRRRAKQPAQDLPTRDRILEVVQDAGAIDDVEALGKRAHGERSACRYSTLRIPSSFVLRFA